MSKLLRRIVGSRAFYAMVFAVVVPIIIQNAITNFVNLLDNLMVGRVGTDQMSAVSIANQLIFVFNLTIFGGLSGAGIFTAQFHGAGDSDGVRATFRFKLYIALGVSAVAIALFLLKGEALISLYLNEENDPARVAETLGYSMQYLRIMLIGLLPFAITECYASTLRETGETAMPMFASIAAVCVNLLFNYLLIFGNFGFPRLGVAGAAWATVLSRFVEMCIITTYAHTHTARHSFIKGLYRSPAIPGWLVKSVTLKGMPLLVNEVLWSIGIASLTQAYSLRGLDVVAATNICNTITNVFSVAFFAMGSAMGIIIGQALGANDVPRAKDYVWKLMVFSIAVCMVMGSILFGVAGAIPKLYNTTVSVQRLAAQFMRITCCFWPVICFSHCAYFVLRSGGKTVMTFCFDSGSVWLLQVPVAYLLSRLTGMGIIGIYVCVQCTEIARSVLGYILLKKGVWIHNIVAN